jgi:D-Ala-teichoic acid biosynthesis protein
MMKRWMTGLDMFIARPAVRHAALLLYYLAILAGLIWLYGRGDFSTPSFIYQGF